MVVDNIIQGDCLLSLKELDDNSIDLIVTDPPYGYKFMGKTWDKAIIGVDIWKEVLRVLKPGAFAFIMSSPRQDVLSRMIVNLEDAGFETGFTSLYWTYSSGFSKAGNVGKLVDKKLGVERNVIGKRNTNIDGCLRKTTKPSGEFDNTKRKSGGLINITEPATPEAKALDGAYCGYQPKPAVKVVLCVMKPLSCKSYTEQAMDNGKGCTWLDDVRVPFESEDDRNKMINKASKDYDKWINQPSIDNKNSLNFGRTITEKGIPDRSNTKGRFPANLISSDDVLNSLCIGDSGSYNRYFDMDKWWLGVIDRLPEKVKKVFPFLIVPKPSKSEKNKGCEKLENGNNHCTVKPLKIFSYLIMLGSREGDLILDPFCGSGTSLISAKILGRNYLGMELEDEYIEIAKARLNAWHEEVRGVQDKK